MDLAFRITHEFRGPKFATQNFGTNPVTTLLALLVIAPVILRHTILAGLAQTIIGSPSGPEGAQSQPRCCAKMRFASTLTGSPWQGQIMSKSHADILLHTSRSNAGWTFIALL